MCIRDSLKIVKIDHLKDRMPTALSGGQQPRVALARAIVIRPQVLLIDEPLSNLDAKLRIEMRNAIKQKTAYEILRSDWSSDVCSSDLSSPQVQILHIRFRMTINVFLIMTSVSYTHLGGGCRFRKGQHRRRFHLYYP